VKDAEDQKMKYFSSNFFIFLPILLAFFFMLSAGIFDLDEGAFASTSLQMLLDQQYLIPYIGETVRLEKPILSYWIQALSMTIFGINEVALRLPSLIAGIFWIYFLCQHCF
jgi:4-amino-4-deoxy-L-arabinose transferase-like glycosyltransferase